MLSAYPTWIFLSKRMLKSNSIQTYKEKAGYYGTHFLYVKISNLLRLAKYFQWSLTYAELFAIYQRTTTANSVILTEIIRVFQKYVLPHSNKRAG